MNQDSKNKSIVVWVGCLLTGFVQFIMLFIDKDDELLQQHAKEASNWVINAFIISIICGLLWFLIIPLFVIMIITLMHCIFCILGAVAASDGRVYRIPVPIMRLIK